MSTPDSVINEALHPSPYGHAHRAPAGRACGLLRLASRLVACLLACLLMLGVPLQRAVGEETSSPLNGLLTADRLTAEIERLENASALNDGIKNNAIELLQQAVEQVEAGRRHQALAEQYSAASRNIPVELKKLESAPPLPAPGEAQPGAGATAAMSAGELQTMLLRQQAEQTTREASLAEMRGRLAARTVELDKARQRLAEVQMNLAEAKLKLSSAALVEDQSPLESARLRLLEAQVQSLSLENRALSEQIVTHPLRFELLQARRDRLAAEAAVAQETLEDLQDALNERRLSEAQADEQKAAAAQRDAEGKHPWFALLAEKNAELGSELRAIAVAQDRVADHSAEVGAAAKRLEEDFRSARRQIEIAGLRQVLGQALRDRRLTLPDVDIYRERATEHENLIAETSLRQITYRDELRELVPIRGYVDRLLDSDPTIAGAAVREELEQLAADRRDLLEKSIEAQERYIRSLTELDFKEHKFIETVEAFDGFLGERLLWVRSSPPLNAEHLLAMPDEFLELLSLRDWLDTAATLASELLRMPLWLAPLLVVAVLVARRRELVAALKATSANIDRPTSDRLLDTWRAVGLTLLLALAWPLLMLVLGVALESSPGADAFAAAVGHSLHWLVGPVLLFETFRMLCHRHGLGAAHFRWSPASLSFLRREVLRIMTVLTPAAFLTMMGSRLGHGGGGVALPFIVVELALAWFLVRILSPGGPVLAPFIRKNAGSLLVKLRFVWYPLVIVVPVALAIAITRGFIFTAGELTNRFVDSLWFVLGLVVVHAVAARWLLITRRHIAYRSAVESREAARREQESGEDEKGELEQLVASLEKPQPNLVALDSETRKLLGLAIVLAAAGGFWLIWSDVLPALSILDRIELWNRSIIEGGVESVAPITIGDLGLAVAIGLVTTILARNLPPFFEVVVMQRLGTSAGSRYAISTLLGYVIAATGALTAMSVIGANWSQLQWLVAALGVGIGFGLQEIVANFISGLIILFERPIRVGDVVTVGDTDGVVTRIQIRATTIRGWDKKELLVPNKEFITGRLLNWSLSDQMNRIMINVGIAYGSDVELALRLLAEVAAENPQVVDDPKPLVVFESFGDSALNLSVRCYLASLDNRLSVTSELNQAINRKFAAAGIEIPFPQRDVNLATDKPLDVRLRAAGEDPSVEQSGPN